MGGGRAHVPGRVGLCHDWCSCCAA
jgi:hypothetical protein